MNVYVCIPADAAEAVLDCAGNEGHRNWWGVRSKWQQISSRPISISMIDRTRPHRYAGSGSAAVYPSEWLLKHLCLYISTAPAAAAAKARKDRRRFHGDQTRTECSWYRGWSWPKGTGWVVALPLPLPLDHKLKLLNRASFE